MSKQLKPGDCIRLTGWAKWHDGETIDNFAYEIINPKPATPSPTMLYCELPQLMAMCDATETVPYKNNFGGMQAGFCLPNGKTWLIVVAMPEAVKVTVVDASVGAIIHDQI